MIFRGETARFLFSGPLPGPKKPRLNFNGLPPIIHRMKIIYSPACLEFEAPGHPESPRRLERAAAYLQKLGYTFIDPRPCSEEDLLRVHSATLVEEVKNLDFVSLDTPRYPGIYEYAKLAVGGALTAADEGGFSLMRPPGHHAGHDFLGGFCYFNNIAAAVQKSARTTLIIDIDGHHGNGTQDIFKNSERVTCISLHKTGYPGTGLTSGRQYYNNMFHGEVGDTTYIHNLQAMLDHLPRAEQVAVSAGFDAYRKDPLASLGLSTEGFERIGRSIRRLGLPVFCVLEGGYAVDDLGENIHRFISGLEGVKE